MSINQIIMEKESGIKIQISNQENDEIVKLEIFDGKGKLIKNRIFTEYLGSGYEIESFNPLPIGHYLVKITNNNSVRFISFHKTN